jgi:hypothetical protein
MTSIPKMPHIPEEKRSPAVAILLEIIQLQREQIQQLRDEIARLKNNTPKPGIKPSNMEPPKKRKKRDDGKRPGSEKRCKTRELEIHDVRKIMPDNLPEGSIFKDYQDFVVQDIILRNFNIRYRLERWITPSGEIVTGQLPPEISNGHFGPTLISFILYQYYHGRVTQPLIYEQLLDLNVDISVGQVNNIITENKERFHLEKDAILRTGLGVSHYIGVDDTGARHDGKNGYCTRIGNEYFAWFGSTDSKSRMNFLKLLCAGSPAYAINAEAIQYMVEQNLPQFVLAKLLPLLFEHFSDESAWQEQLQALGIRTTRHIRIATEGALIGSLIENGFRKDLVILSDGAGQFILFLHALCWIHTERSINKLTGFNKPQRDALEKVRADIWDLYYDLKKYKSSPDERQKVQIKERFDEIFTRKTCFATLNQTLKRIHHHEDELLLVLERPEIPLHNNLSENDIREYVTKRKISGSTRSSPGRRCRDTFASLKKTCRKHGISFWEYLLDRIRGKNIIPQLSDLIRLCAQEFVAE